MVSKRDSDMSALTVGVLCKAGYTGFRVMDYSQILSILSIKQMIQYAVKRTREVTAANIIQQKKVEAEVVKRLKEKSRKIYQVKRLKRL